MSYHYHISFTQLHYAAFAAILTFTMVLIRQKYSCNSIYFKNQIFFTMTSLIGPTSYSMIGPFLIWSNFDPAFLIKKIVLCALLIYVERRDTVALGIKAKCGGTHLPPSFTRERLQFHSSLPKQHQNHKTILLLLSLGQDGTTTRSGGKMAAMCGGEISGYYF